MASLIENLMDILEKEEEGYQELLQLSIKKGSVVVKGDIEELQKIMDEEQNVVSQVNHLDKQRQEVMNDIANVLNKDVESLKLSQLIGALDAQPEERKRLAAINDKLTETITHMKRINEQNWDLIQSALEMVEFDLNLIQNLKAEPETANYNKGAQNAGDSFSGPQGGFDAKQ